MPTIERKFEQISNKKLINDYTEVLMSDFHYSPDICKRKLRDLKDYLEKEKGSTSFVTMPGDITYAQNYLRKKFYSYLVGELHELYFAAGAPIIISLGNHDMQFLGEENGRVRAKFKDLSDGEIVALDNDKYEFNDDITISGITSTHKSYSYQNFFGGNSRILIDELKRVFSEGFDSEKFNIMLMHDPNAVYNVEDTDQEKYFKNIDQFVSGHLHGGHIKSDILQILDETSPNYGMGKKEFFRKGKLRYTETPRCYGHYLLSNGLSRLIVTEGISRYKGFIPNFLYNDPYVTKISIKSPRPILI